MFTRSCLDSALSSSLLHPQKLQHLHTFGPTNTLLCRYSNTPPHIERIASSCGNTDEHHRFNSLQDANNDSTSGIFDLLDLGLGLFSSTGQPGFGFACSPVVGDAVSATVSLLSLMLYYFEKAIQVAKDFCWTNKSLGSSATLEVYCLTNLSKSPASKVQILIAEKALFCTYLEDEEHYPEALSAHCSSTTHRSFTFAVLTPSTRIVFIASDSLPTSAQYPRVWIAS
ncbi:hypothetical protein HGRIS_003289 [Hohenbuehelia grisea]|uniref:Uncharacterized protein n=1 Tax=Hohenbuehelia grisea TaxID=104357 RepID=A0ABR3JPC5_9AGAR